MGIPDLRKLLKQEAPNSMQEKTLEEYRGQKVAIDANILFFEFMATSLGRLKSNTNKPTGHLLGFLQRTVKFLSLQIDPIYIFDGDTLKMKLPELQRRRAEKYGNVKVASYLGRKSEEALKRYKECEMLLSLMGVPCFMALNEGEAQCCHLCKTDQMLDELGLTKESFIDFCILAGCDYCDRIEGMNGEKALELIRQFRTIENVLENIDRNKYQISEKWLAQYQDARLQFTEPQVKNIADDELKTKDIDEQRLKLYLVTVHDFQSKTVDKNLSIIRLATVGSNQGSSTQGSTQHSTKSSMLITQFYKRSVEKGTGEGESSKRSKP